MQGRIVTYRPWGIQQKKMSKTVSARRNPYVSLAKFVGACFIVLGHSKFPGITGKLVECAGRLAVPFFFVISGYYSFEVPAKIIRKRIKKLFG